MSERFIQWIRTASDREFGAFGEKLWSAIFHTADLNYVPLCSISNGGAPMQEGKDKIILPDFEASSHRFRVYVDSKAKRQPILYRMAKELRHGVFKRNYYHYKEISERNRQHCCLAIFEAFEDNAHQVWSGALLMQSLAKLGKPFDGNGPMADTVFFPRDRFSTIGNVTPQEAINICNRNRELPVFKDALWELLDIRTQAPMQKTLF